VTRGGGLNRNESTWSPHSVLEERPTIRDLEDLYATLTGQRPRSYVPLPMPMTASGAMRRRSFSVAPRRTSFSLSPQRRRDSLSRPTSRPPNVGLATITETNSPGRLSCYFDSHVEIGEVGKVLEITEILPSALPLSYGIYLKVSVRAIVKRGEIFKIFLVLRLK
jgi:hypothetical protein